MPNDSKYDFIVVGSGAGGGPLAANLARRGFKVLVMEAGTDQGSRLTYQVPAFHGAATEDPAMSWAYFVRHYSDDAQQKLDSKYDTGHNGIFYPRSGTLGGCTAHNAMITVYGHNIDWDHIRDATGDDSWSSDNMRTYFERLERCEYVRSPGNGQDRTRHGFNGWLTTSKADARLAVKDVQLLKVLASAALQTLLRHVADPAALVARLLLKLELLPTKPLELVQLLLRDPFDPDTVAQALVEHAADFLDRILDPNDWAFVSGREEGPVFVPLAVRGGIHDPDHRGWRSSPREYLLDTCAHCPPPGKLDIWTDVLVTRVVLEENSGKLAAVGVKYVKGPNQYAADPAASKRSRPDLAAFLHQEQEVRAGREVILAAGAFNTPQLLMLSGIGPQDVIEKFKDAAGKPVISCRVRLAGVGRNLQDRYEVGVITELKEDLAILQGVAFEPPASGLADDQAKNADRALKQWAETGTGLYTTNGAVLGIILRSDPSRDDPDLFIFGLPGFFKGYFENYSKEIVANRNRFTWAILKARTENTAGYVRLRSPDPRDTPEINFKYFDEGNDTDRKDVAALIAGVKFIRELMSQPVLAGMVRKLELLPGGDIRDDAAIDTFVRKEAWGHHASCTCPIGPRDQGGVLDGDFRVHGVDNLRVVDASVFPRIPGFFIVTPIYMIAEKASDVIERDARAGSGLQGGVSP
jgi:choline dehydrogenase